jgi:two-component system sensor histidine kinase VanS
MEEVETANQQLTKDVKKFQRLEEQHRNFFAAVSHELKTPLTILKGQLENMILGFGDYQNHDKYLPQALKSAEDIEYLVKEILSITKMETMNIGSSLETLSLADMVSKVVTELQPLATEKDIAIFQNISEDIRVSVNRNLFGKALSNIIGNAIRHSKADAKVYADCDTDTHILVVENTGVFLDEDNLENMFTPFYRADKSRSKATGGSGLGLYIVKTILDLHQMEYQITNTDKGVAFYLKLN